MAHKRAMTTKMENKTIIQMGIKMELKTGEEILDQFRNQKFMDFGNKGLEELIDEEIEKAKLVGFKEKPKIIELVKEALEDCSKERERLERNSGNESAWQVVFDVERKLDKIYGFLIVEDSEDES